MSGRYYITGVQLGMIVSDIKAFRLKTMQMIIDTQFFGNVGDKGTDKIMELIKQEEGE